MRSLGIGINRSRKALGGGALPIDADAQLYFDACTLAGADVTGDYITWYNNLFYAMKSSGIWANQDKIFIFATGNRIWAKICLKTLVAITTSNDYGGDFSAGVGFVGNGTNVTGFRYLVNFNPTVGTWNYTRNDCSVTLLCTSPCTVGTGHDISSFNGGFSQGTFIKTNVGERHSINQIWTPTPDVFNNYSDMSRPYSWLMKKRVTSNISHTYYNGLLIEIDTDASVAILNQDFGGLNAYGGGAFAGGSFFSNASHGALLFGNNTVAQKDIITCFNQNFFTPQNTKAAIENMLYFDGDSRTGDKTAPTLSVSYAMVKRASDNLGDKWGSGAVSHANDQISNMIAQFPTEIAPYYNSNYVKKFAVLWGGTNDIAASVSGADVYARMVTLANLYKALGVKVIIVGEIDRNFSSYAAMNTQRAVYQTLMLADFNSAIGTNIYAPASGVTYADAFINLYAEANFQSFASAWYQVDQIHPNITGAQKVGDYVSAAVNLL